MLYLTGISIALFLSLLLVTKKNKTQADKILALWLLILGLHLLFYYLSFSDKIYEYPVFFGLQFPMPLLHGPFLYLYAGALTRRITPGKVINFLHFAPALAFFGLFIQFYSMPVDQKISIVQKGGTGYQPFYSLALASVIISGFVYVLLTIVLLRKHRRTILNQFSYTGKINLQWLQYLTYGIGLVWIVIVFSYDEIIFAAAVLFILFIGYFGIRQVGIFTQSNTLTDNADARLTVSTGLITGSKTISVDNIKTDSAAEEFIRPGISKKKYSKSGLTKEAALKLQKHLNQIMESEKLFKKSELSLSELADTLNTHPNYLSQVINEIEGKNFFDYINSLRAKEFIEIASRSENQKYTLLGLAYDCGFNSKSSFNKYFKKLTGQSPSGYLNQQRKD